MQDNAHVAMVILALRASPVLGVTSIPGVLLNEELHSLFARVELVKLVLLCDMDDICRSISMGMDVDAHVIPDELADAGTAAMALRQRGGVYSESGLLESLLVFGIVRVQSAIDVAVMAACVSVLEEVADQQQVHVAATDGFEQLEIVAADVLHLIEAEHIEILLDALRGFGNDALGVQQLGDAIVIEPAAGVDVIGVQVAG